MNWNVHLFHALRGLWKKAAIIAIALILFQFVFVLLASSTSIKTSIIDDIHEVPDSMKKVMGKGFIESMIKYGVVAVGYIHPFVYFLYIIFIVLAVSFMITSEVTTGTIGFLLSKPVSRERIFFNMFLVVFCGLVFLTLCSYLATVIGVEIFTSGKMPAKPFFPITVNLFLMMFFVSGYVALITAFSNTSRKMYTRAAVILSAFYLVDWLSPLWTFLSFTDRINPFSYYKPLEILAGGRIDLTTGIAIFVVSLLMYFAGMKIFNRRDIFSG